MSDAPAFGPVSRAELVAVLADAIRATAGGEMTRLGETFLAGLAAEHLAERIALAGFVVMRQRCSPTPQRSLWES